MEYNKDMIIKNGRLFKNACIRKELYYNKHNN